MITVMNFFRRSIGRIKKISSGIKIWEMSREQQNQQNTVQLLVIGEIKCGPSNNIWIRKNTLHRFIKIIPQGLPTIMS